MTTIEPLFIHINKIRNLQYCIVGLLIQLFRFFFSLKKRQHTTIIGKYIIIDNLIFSMHSSFCERVH